MTLAENLVDAYSAAVLALGVMAALMLVQLLVADVVGIRRRHVPGTPVPAEHDDLLFRVARTVANTNESIAIFLGALLFCVLAGASPDVTASAAWAFVGCRAAYAACYYANIKLARSAFFALSPLALVVLLVAGAVAV